MSHSEMQDVEMITYLRLHLNISLCVKTLFLTFGYLDERFIENKGFLKNNLDAQCINKTIPEKIIIVNF